MLVLMRQVCVTPIEELVPDLKPIQDACLRTENRLASDSDGNPEVRPTGLEMEEIGSSCRVRQAGAGECADVAGALTWRGEV
eukprot:782983-Prorocentrum_minimum.AAC.1